MGLIWVFWVVLGGLLCGWCWVYGGVSWCFAGIVVVVQLFFFFFFCMGYGLVGDVGR